MSTVEEPEIIVPSSPADRKALQDAIIEMNKSLNRIVGEQDYINETLKSLKEKFKIDTKWLRKMLTDFHKDQFDKTVKEADEYAELFEMIMLKSHNQNQGEEPQVEHSDADEPEDLDEEYPGQSPFAQ
ncbi:hypothetical protein pf16_69 [Pseudomonas phage pf16]|uniref:Uncharacterized protein n=1 Tax=Pseudomonas phage pf16 TaxID=1815630 RepID=A0A1S5R3L3_9CAUD|nr:transcriptional regulator [Pseudomonas phage pf16]AND74992.1 hypothetical protein pf16_69 [Pseudomonas phage pf16]